MVLRCENVCKSFDDMQVVAGFSATFPERGIVGVTGSSGVGKTTLLRLIAGIEQPDEGCVAGVPDCVSMQFEDDRLFPWMDALANVTLVGASEETARSLFKELGLEGRDHARISELSGGQRRRVAVARALAYEAPLYLFDEPTARLDEESATLVLDAIARHCSNALAITATHDSRAADFCDVVVQLS